VALAVPRTWVKQGLGPDFLYAAPTIVHECGFH
jgi:hypothetical protein